MIPAVNVHQVTSERPAGVHYSGRELDSARNMAFHRSRQFPGRWLVQTLQASGEWQVRGWYERGTWREAGDG